MSRMGGFRDIGFVSHCLPTASKSSTCHQPSNDALVVSLKSTYQNDYCPLDKIGEREKIAEPKKKFNMIDCLCKCGSKAKTSVVEVDSKQGRRISEYNASIGKCAKLIIQHNIHDHRKCPRHCVHVWKI